MDVLYQPDNQILVIYNNVINCHIPMKKKYCYSTWEITDFMVCRDEYINNLSKKI